MVLENLPQPLIMMSPHITIKCTEYQCHHRQTVYDDVATQELPDMLKIAMGNN